MTAPFPIARAPQRVDIDAVRGVAGIAQIFGRDVEVYEMDGAGYRALYTLEAAPASADIRELYGLVARIVPALTAEEVDRLTARQVGAIVGLSQATIRQVEEAHGAAADPNAAGPATEASPSPSASAPAIPSATS